MPTYRPSCTLTAQPINTSTFLITPPQWNVSPLLSSCSADERAWTRLPWHQWKLWACTEEGGSRMKMRKVLSFSGSKGYFCPLLRPVRLKTRDKGVHVCGFSAVQPENRPSLTVQPLSMCLHHQHQASELRQKPRSNTIFGWYSVLLSEHRNNKHSQRGKRLQARPNECDIGRQHGGGAHSPRLRQHRVVRNVRQSGLLGVGEDQEVEDRLGWELVGRQEDLRDGRQT